MLGEFGAVLRLDQGGRVGGRVVHRFAGRRDVAPFKGPNTRSGSATNSRRRRGGSRSCAPRLSMLELRMAFVRCGYSGGDPVMSKSEKYQRFAEECVQIARTAKDDQVKAALMHMAQVWFRLAADRAKKIDEEEEAT